MKLIDPNITTNELPILPRKFDANVATTVIFINEDTSLSTTVTPSTIAYSGNDLILSIEVPNLIEGQRYSFKVKQLTDVIYKDIALVTEFNSINYTINPAEFTVDTNTDSDIIPTYE
jgi:hypothetical protein|tara:strand:- start:111 stop:461 length:351 start_codon:yes stop_codon:yes gene_type:complete